VDTRRGPRRAQARPSTGAVTAHQRLHHATHPIHPSIHPSHACERHVTEQSHSIWTHPCLFHLWYRPPGGLAFARRIAVLPSRRFSKTGMERERVVIRELWRASTWRKSLVVLPFVRTPTRIFGPQGNGSTAAPVRTYVRTQVLTQRGFFFVHTSHAALY
jgi:hypothetical protein